MDKLVLRLTTAQESREVTQLCSSVTLSGDLRQCCRTLTVEVAVHPDARFVPYVYFPLGGCVELFIAGVRQFYGTVVSKSKATDADTMTLTCFDRGFYLKNNYATYNFTAQSPAAITRRVCTDFGIPVGSLPDTDAKISRKFRGAALYSILDTAWTLAGERNGSKYRQWFDGPQLFVGEKRAEAGRAVLRTGVNLLSAAYSESIEEMVNRISIYDDADHLVRSVSDEAAIRLYGLLRRVVQQGKNDDKLQQAQRTLEDEGVARRVTVNCLGDASLVTGRAVQLLEPFTGQLGLFWIDSDEHRWKNGVYTNKLTLNFRNMVREGDAGTEDQNGK